MSIAELDKEIVFASIEGLLNEPPNLTRLRFNGDVRKMESEWRRVRRWKVKARVELEKSKTREWDSLAFQRSMNDSRCFDIDSEGVSWAHRLENGSDYPRLIHGLLFGYNKRTCTPIRDESWGIEWDNARRENRLPKCRYYVALYDSPSMKGGIDVIPSDNAQQARLLLDWAYYHAGRKFTKFLTSNKFPPRVRVRWDLYLLASKQL